MRMTVTAYDSLGFLVVNVTHTEREETELVTFKYGGTLHVPMGDLVEVDYSPADLLAFLAESLLDMAYDRRC